MKGVKNTYIFLAIILIIIFLIILFYNPHPTGNAIIGSGNDLIAYYPFEGDVSDLSDTNIDGINREANLTKSGINGYCADFNGIYTYIDTNRTFSELTNTFTISLWINPKSIQPQYAAIFGNAELYKGMVLQQNYTGTNRFVFWYANSSDWLGTTSTGRFTNGIAKTINLTANTWTHLVIIKNSTNCSVYIDGVRAFITPCLGNVVMDSNQKLKIGQGYSNTSIRYFNGSVDEFRIYKRQLNDEEISTLYNRGCYIKLSNIAYTGTNNQKMTIGTDSIYQDSYLCYNYDIYSCKTHETYNINVAENYQQIGSWQCDIESKKWNDITPRFLKENPNCNYGTNCGAFEISSSMKGGNFAYELYWSYYLKNGSIVDYCIKSSKNKDSCSILSSNQGTKKVNVSTTENSTFYGNLYENITTNFNESVDKIILSAATSKNNHRSNWINTTINVNYSTCNNTVCSFSGQVQCNGTNLYQRKICGNFDSDPCLEWSSQWTNCEEGKICVGGMCQEGSTSDSCINAGGMCLNNADLNNIPRNMVVITGNCPSSEYSCYQCNTTGLFSWNNNTRRCEMTGCSNNCTTVNGICNYEEPTTIENATINTNYTCCGEGSCYICNAGSHMYNGQCISNNCSGNFPDSAGVEHPLYNKTILGTRNFTIGAVQNWTYINLASLSSCQWKCAEDTHRVPNETFNGCVDGAAPCDTLIGCKITGSVSNATTINQNCSVGYSCYICNQGYTWNLTESNCISNCPICVNGCSLNCQQCLPTGYRLTDGNTRKFCSSAKTMQTQKSDETTCSTNYECESNYCSKNNKCTSLVNEISQTRIATQNLICWFQKLFGASVTCS